MATKRVKHAIKSDIPSIGDHVSKLVHIGKATVDKLQDIQNAAAEESLDIKLPPHLNTIDKVRGGATQAALPGSVLLLSPLSAVLAPQSEAGWPVRNSCARAAGTQHGDAQDDAAWGCPG